MSRLGAWVCQRLDALTDYAIEAVLARLGEPMEWRDVERLARERAEEEERLMQEFVEWCCETKGGTKPPLRLVQKS